MNDPLRDALAEALRLHRHEYISDYELAHRSLAHPAVLAALAGSEPAGLRESVATHIGCRFNHAHRWPDCYDEAYKPDILDVAWERAEAALPDESWTILVGGGPKETHGTVWATASGYDADHTYPRIVSSKSGKPPYFATPTEALDALTAALQSEATASGEGE